MFFKCFIQELVLLLFQGREIRLVMKNLTSNWTKQNYINRADWIVPLTVNILLTIAVIWIILSLVDYGIKNKKWRRVERNNYEKLSSGWIYSTVLLCAAFCLVRYVISLISLVDVKAYNERMGPCKTNFYLRACLYTFIHLSVWLFLWLRQYTFYANRMLALNYSKPVRYLSFITILLIVISAICFSIFPVLTYDLKISAKGCTSAPRLELAVGYWAFVGITVILVHGILFGLFAYALMKSRSNDKTKELSINNRINDTKNKNSVSLKKFTRKSETTTSTINTPNGSVKKPQTQFTVTEQFTNARRQSSKKTKSKKKVKLILKKSFFLVLISVALEIFLPLFWNYIKVNERIVMTSYSVTALFNLLMTIFSFVYYKNMLFSFCI